MVRILQNTIIFANNDKDVDNLDQECHIIKEKNESAASYYVFQCSQWQHAIPGVASLIPARSHTFVEIDHEIISTVILLPSADSFRKGCCQLQAKVCARIITLFQ